MESAGYQVTGNRPPAGGGNIRIPLCLFILLLVVKFFFVYQRYFPILFYDEAVYIYKARNFAAFFSYFTPSGVIDILDIYAPLYSFILSPVFVFFQSPEVTYKLVLFVNAVLTSAIVFPLFLLASAFYPRYKTWITLSAATLASSFGYVFSAMSEALFVPLFCFAVYLYYRKLETDRTLFHLLFWLSWCLLLLTKNVCIVLIPAYLLITLLCFFRGGTGPNRWKSLLSDVVCLVIVSIPRLIWNGVLKAHGGTEQTAANYLNQGLLHIGDSFSRLAQYAGTWIGQLGYLVLSTFTLGLFVLFYCSGRKGIKEGAPSPGRQMALMIFVSGLFLIGASTAHMFMTGLPGIHARYLMYGRYADMLAPLLLLFGLGQFTRLDMRAHFRTRRLRGILIVSIFLLTLLITVYHIPPFIEGVRVLNMGVGWVDHLMRSLPLYHVIIFILSLVLLSGAFVSRKYRIVPVFTLVLLLNAVNIARVHHQVLLHEAKGREFVRQAQKIRSDPSAKLWVHKKNLDGKFFCRVSYYFHSDTFYLQNFRPVDVARDYVVWGKDILKMSDCASALKEDLAKEKKKWGHPLKTNR